MSNEQMKSPLLRVGREASRTRRFTVEEIDEYLELSGDAGLAWSGIPGPLLAGLVSDLLGTELPGEGTMWMKQRMSFPAPAPLGAAIVARVQITRLRPEKDLVNLASVVTADGVTVLDGETLVLVPGLDGRMEEPR